MRTLSLVALSLVVVGSFMLGACQPVCEDLGPQYAGECRPHYRAKFLKEGFNLKVTHSRWQFKPDLDTMFDTCRNSIHYYAPVIAASKGKEIEPINDGAIAMDYDRDHHSGVSTCIASYPVAYKQ